MTHDDVVEPASVEERSSDEARPSPATPAATAAPSRRRLRLLVALVAALAVVCGAATTVAVREAGRADDLHGGAADRRAVASVAGAFGEALLTYDYRDLNTARGRVLALSTDQFGNQYSASVSSGTVADQITELQAVSSATVRDVYVEDISGDTAKAVVTADSQVDSTAGTNRTIGSFLALTLVREGDAWKVDTVTSLAALDRQTTPAEGAGPSGPSAPTVPTGATPTTGA